MRNISLGPTLPAGPLHLPEVLLVAAAPRLQAGLLYVAGYLTVPISRPATQGNLRAQRLDTEVLGRPRVTTLVIALLLAEAVLPCLRRRSGRRGGSPGPSRARRGPGRGTEVATATNRGAGVRIAISQPVRVDGVVVLEGGWGRVEEISLTVVVGRAAPWPSQNRRFRSRRRAYPVVLSSGAQGPAEAARQGRCPGGRPPLRPGP